MSNTPDNSRARFACFESTRFFFCSRFCLSRSASARLALAASCSSEFRFGERFLCGSAFVVGPVDLDLHAVDVDGADHLSVRCRLLPLLMLPCASRAKRSACVNVPLMVRSRSSGFIFCFWLRVCARRRATQKTPRPPHPKI
jgi:hypothetical protein